jgi:hypothetical protein
MNERAQASVMDALFLLAVVAVLATLLYFFSSIYGTAVMAKISNQYKTDYATGALQTLLYSSVPRLYDEDVNIATQVDYLLAAIKEDYADDKQISMEMLNWTRANLETIMNPVQSAFDYVFYIYIPPYYIKASPQRQTGGSGSSQVQQTVNPEFVIMILKRTEYDIVDGKPQNPRTVFYYCKPPSMEVFENKFITKVGGISGSAGSMIYLVVLEKQGNDYVPNYAVAQVQLIMWPSTYPYAKNITGDLLTSPTYMNCQRAPD